MGTREGVAAKIDAETKVKIEEMNKMVQMQKEAVSIFSISKPIIFYNFYLLQDTW